MADSDLRVRLAAFAFLDEQRRRGADLMARQVLAAGFSFEGHRVPLLGPQGIFKPRICRLPLSITAVPAREGQQRPYDDVFGEDGLLRYGAGVPDGVRTVEPGRPWLTSSGPIGQARARLIDNRVGTTVLN